MEHLESSSTKIVMIDSIILELLEGTKQTNYQMKTDPHAVRLEEAQASGNIYHGQPQLYYAHFLLSLFENCSLNIVIFTEENLKSLIL